MNETEQQDALALLTQAMDLQASSPFVLMYAHCVAGASVLGFRTSQIIDAINFFGNDNNFYDSSSHSPFLSTRDRFYDDGKKIKAYEAIGRERLGETKAKVYDYDAFIQTYGKLPKKKYYVFNRFTDKDALIHDAYLSDKESVFRISQESAKRAVYGLTIYKITKETIRNQSAEILEDGTARLTFELDVRFADDYNRLQMLHIGGLYELPKFTSSKVTFDIDKDGYLVEAHYEDTLDAKTGFITASVAMASDITYLRSRNSHFTYRGVTQAIRIPSAEEPFNGYSLFEDNGK